MSFSADLSKITKSIDGKMDKVYAALCLEVFNRVILRTPVGNPDYWKKPVKGYVGGRLRANWQFTKFTPAKGEKDTTKWQSNHAAVQDQAAKVAATETAYLTNNLPYAVAVENGHSTRQAPAGMVKVSLAEVEKIVKDKVAKIK